MEIGSLGWYIVTVVCIHIGILGLIYYSIQNQSQKESIEEMEQTLDSGLLEYIHNESPVKREHIGALLRKSVLERDNYTCLYCGEQGTQHHDPDGNLWSIDHIQPISRGGATIPANLTACCSWCNSAKKDLTAVEYLKKRFHGITPRPRERGQPKPPKKKRRTWAVRPSKKTRT